MQKPDPKLQAAETAQVAELAPIPLAPVIASPFTGAASDSSAVRFSPGVSFDPAPSVESFDRLMHAMQGRLTGGISPTALQLAYVDWFSHLASAPGKQIELWRKFVRKFARFLIFSHRALANGVSPRRNGANGLIWECISRFC
jgi:polyhydroxyalkanoate synthase